MSKTTIRVRKQRWEYFNRECKAMSLRRDDLLNRLLPGELARLASIPSCDAIGARWIKDRWITAWTSGDLEMMSVPILFSSEVVQLLNDTCADKSIPRDAFLDCFLEFLTARLTDAALVLRDPRTRDDLSSQVADTLTDNDLNDAEAQGHLLEIGSAWRKRRNLTAWSDDFYQKRLSYDADRVDVERVVLEGL